MTDTVTWVKALEHEGDAECLAYTILDAVKAHPSAVMDIELRADAYETIVAVAVIADTDTPDETAFWKVVLLSGGVPGDEW
jgi:hypothetical protein